MPSIVTGEGGPGTASSGRLSTDVPLTIETSSGASEPNPESVLAPLFWELFSLIEEAVTRIVGLPPERILTPVAGDPGVGESSPCSKDGEVCGDCAWC